MSGQLSRLPRQIVDVVPVLTVDDSRHLVTAEPAVVQRGHRFLAVLGPRKLDEYFHDHFRVRLFALEQSTVLSAISNNCDITKSNLYFTRVLPRLEM